MKKGSSRIFFECFSSFFFLLLFLYHQNSFIVSSLLLLSPSPTTLTYQPIRIRRCPDAIQTDRIHWALFSFLFFSFLVLDRRQSASPQHQRRLCDVHPLLVSFSVADSAFILVAQVSTFFPPTRMRRHTPSYTHTQETQT